MTSPAMVLMPPPTARSRTRRIEVAPAYRAESRAASIRAGALISGARDVWRALADIRSATQEHLVAFDLDVRHRVIAKRIVAIGSLTAVEIHPREVYAQAIVNGAASLILGHNHPSTDPTPSPADIEMTTRARQVGELVGIPLLDHVIVGGDGYTSMSEREWR